MASFRHCRRVVDDRRSAGCVGVKRISRRSQHPAVAGCTSTRLSAVGPNPALNRIAFSTASPPRRPVTSHDGRPIREDRAQSPECRLHFSKGTSLCRRLSAVRYRSEWPRRGCHPAGLVGVRETGLMWANMLRAFQVGKALTSDGEPSIWMRFLRVAWAQVSWPACHLTKASASAVM